MLRSSSPVESHERTRQSTTAKGTDTHHISMKCILAREGIVEILSLGRRAWRRGMRGVAVDGLDRVEGGQELVSRKDGIVGK